MTQNAPAKRQTDTVRQALEKMKGQFALALPKHLTPDRLLRVTMTAVQNTPKLLECDRTSLFSAVMTCAQLGLEPDGVLGQAYLVPFKGKVQFIPGYKGLLTLARNSGEISTVQAHAVRVGDDFSYAYGLNEHLDHVPAEDNEDGEITHFYAYAKFKDGGHIFEVMTRAAVDRIRDQAEGYKAFKANKIKSTPWVDHYPQMGRKTAIRRVANYLPMSVQRAVAIEAAYEAGDHAEIDKFGEIVIDNDTGEVIEDDTGDDNKPNPASEKLDNLAAEGAAANAAQGEPDAVEADNPPEGGKPPAAKAKPRAAAKKAAPKKSTKAKKPEEGAALFGDD